MKTHFKPLLVFFGLWSLLISCDSQPDVSKTDTLENRLISEGHLTMGKQELMQQFDLTESEYTQLLRDIESGDINKITKFGMEQTLKGNIKVSEDEYNEIDSAYHATDWESLEPVYGYSLEKKMERRALVLELLQCRRTLVTPVRVKNYRLIS